MGRCPPSTMGPPPCLQETKHTFRGGRGPRTASTQRRQTGVRDDGVEGQVLDAPLAAHRGPRRLTRMVKLHHQGEAGPGEVRADVLLKHQRTITAANADETRKAGKRTPFQTGNEDRLCQKCLDGPADHTGSIQLHFVLGMNTSQRSS